MSVPLRAVETLLVAADCGGVVVHSKVSMLFPEGSTMRGSVRTLVVVLGLGVEGLDMMDSSDCPLVPSG